MPDNPDIAIPWPGWRAVRRLGRGAYGSVWEIERDVAGEPERCALKVVGVPPEGDWDGSLGLGYDEGALSRSYGEQADQVLREYQLMASLSHPNVVACRDVAKVPHAGDPGCDVYIRMELLTPLPRWLRGREPDPRDAARAGLDVARALEACEARGIVHRDIKPANIMVDGYGNFKLGDFGVARTMEGTRTATVAGTESFMAPEVERRERYNQTVDIYSLGLVMWWMLSGYRGPFMPAGGIAPGDVARAEARRLQGEPVPAPDGCPEGLASIVLKACAYRPEELYQSATEMVADLEKFLDMKSSGTIPIQIETSPIEEPGSPSNPSPKKSGKGIPSIVRRGFIVAGAYIVGRLVADALTTPRPQNKDDDQSADNSVHVDPEKKEEVPVLTHDEQEANRVWPASVDGDSLVYLSGFDSDNKPTSIRIIGLDGNGDRELASLDSSCCVNRLVAADGSVYYCSYYNDESGNTVYEVHSLDEADGETSTVYSANFSEVIGDYSEYYYSNFELFMQDSQLYARLYWSPDESGSFTQRLISINVESGTQETVVPDATFDGDIWTSFLYGTRLYTITKKAEGTSSLFVQDFGSSDAVDVCDFSGTWDAFDWNTANQNIYFYWGESSQDSSSYSYYSADADGSNLQSIGYSGWVSNLDENGIRTSNGWLIGSGEGGRLAYHTYSNNVVTYVSTDRYGENENVLATVQQQ